MEWLTIAGLVIVLVGVLSYVALLFVVQRFTYRTWLFDAPVGLGMVLAGVGWLAGGNAITALAALLIGLVWFPLTRRELRIRGSEQLNVRPGDRFPSMSVSTIDGTEVTERDLIANAPTLLVLYRGWWCPSHKSQLDELVGAYEQFAEAGLSVYAGSVDSPTEAAPIQEQLGDKVTILCDVSTALLDEIGVRDQRGAPWYDRLIFGAKQQDIAMPAAFVIDDTGTVLYAYRSTRVDDRPEPAQILANL